MPDILLVYSCWIMELRRLRYLVAVAEELHFGRAAIRLRISQPPLSQQIQQLEAELGVKLFHRTKREVRLTDPGKRIVSEAQLILRQADHFIDVASRISEGAIGHLPVAGPGGVNEILVKALRRNKRGCLLCAFVSLCLCDC